MSVLKKTIAHRYFKVSLLACSTILFSAQTQIAREYQIKAVFLFNFAQFVEWPTTSFQETNAIVIGVLGDDPFGTYLDEAVRGEEVNGHPLVVQRYRHINDIKACHILFINAAETRQQVLASLKPKSILTVSDADNFTKQGGMILFFTENKKTRIRINLNATKDANLTISSKLLRLAEIVGPQKN
ncbi:MAG: YfiR family protein [Bacteroidetes bacterium]|nr:YfiR family protein [Bacteroidota bacterium]